MSAEVEVTVEVEFFAQGRWERLLPMNRETALMSPVELFEARKRERPEQKYRLVKVTREVLA